MSDLTPERLAELRRIAEAATPGPWEVVGLSGYSGPYALRMPHRSGRTWYGVEGIKRREDAEYFAACDPDTIRELLAERDALAAENERLHEQLRRETERRWEGNRRAAQEYVDDMRDVLREAARVCKDLDDEALAKENRLACGAECAAAIADLAARMNVPFEGEQQ